MLEDHTMEMIDHESHIFDQRVPSRHRDWRSQHPDHSYSITFSNQVTLSWLIVHRPHKSRRLCEVLHWLLEPFLVGSWDPPFLNPSKLSFIHPLVGSCHLTLTPFTGWTGLHIQSTGNPFSNHSARNLQVVVHMPVSINTQF